MEIKMLLSCVLFERLINRIFFIAKIKLEYFIYILGYNGYNGYLLESLRKFENYIIYTKKLMLLVRNIVE